MHKKDQKPSKVKVDRKHNISYLSNGGISLNSPKRKTNNFKLSDDINYLSLTNLDETARSPVRKLKKSDQKDNKIPVSRLKKDSQCNELA